jgi:hydrogenase-4 component F
LAIISLPPSPMFFSELYGFGSMVSVAKESHHLLAMIGAILLLLLFLALIFYKFVEIYQSMKYEGEEGEKKVYLSELLSLVIFAVATASLILPQVISYIEGIA